MQCDGGIDTMLDVPFPPRLRIKTYLSYGTLGADPTLISD